MNKYNLAQIFFRQIKCHPQIRHTLPVIFRGAFDGSMDTFRGRSGSQTSPDEE